MISRRDAKAAKTDQTSHTDEHSHWAAPQGPLFRGAVREKA